MANDPEDLTNALSISGGYDDVHSAILHLKPGMIFIDIGANAGVFSLIAGKLVGPEGLVFSFEPSPVVFRRLVHNTYLNGLTNIYPFMAAVGPQLGIANFSAGPTSHSGIGHLDPGGNSKVLEISAVTLGPLLASIETRETMIKVDVEGAEFLVLEELDKAGILGRAVRVIVEVDPEYLVRFGHTAEQIYTLMKARGYMPRYGHSHSEHFNEIFDHASA